MSIYPDIKFAGNSGDCYSNVPQKKVLHFSDGTLEVDEVDGNPPNELESNTEKAVNPQELTWMPWLWYQTTAAGAKALEVCDYVGESLASFFGITTPKYQFEINEYNRIKKEEEEEKREDLEMGAWANKPNENEAVSSGPKTYDALNQS